ncbi:hypothetical protein M878_44655 [Streptomyces roseochromogenus subsp. oscitans DS 12.976]|uniref:Uncharacterized protein n=2 Tax=Streptomyces roseochromogenus TaxID=285450 RepID=V6JFR9_STRRC|nr:hypothetical protein M878_44655 [Streptomyces roseochromogenus subsp. oscitans DS 12.976]
MVTFHLPPDGVELVSTAVPSVVPTNIAGVTPTGAVITPVFAGTSTPFPAMWTGCHRPLFLAVKKMSTL